jgi:hypothetical protein
MKYSGDYPHMYNFMRKVVFETDPGIKDAISSINQKYTTERAMAFFQGLDYSKFKEGIDPMMVIQLLTWCSEGCVNQILLQEKLQTPNDKLSLDFEKVITLYHSYIDLFRNNFYKEEYLKPKSQG